MERRVVQLDGPHGLPTIWGVVKSKTVPTRYEDWVLDKATDRAAYYRLATAEDLNLPAAFIPFVSTT